MKTLPNHPNHVQLIQKVCQPCYFSTLSSSHVEKGTDQDHSADCGCSPPHHCRAHAPEEPADNIPDATSERKHLQSPTEANVARHSGTTTSTGTKPSAIQKWLGSTDDALIQGREAVDWEELVRLDELAADIEKIIRNGTT